MAVNKVTLGNQTLIDLTGDTISAGDALVGVSLHLASGESAVGTLGDFTGATSSAAGTHGLVPAPAAGDNAKFLRGDGTWQTAGGSSASAMTEAEIQTAFDAGWPATYSVQITLSSYGGSGSYFGSCTVYGADSANVNSTTTTLGTIDSGDASKLFTVGVDTPYLVVVLAKSASASGGLYVDTSGISTTGLVTSMNSGVQQTNPARMLFAVNGDGTATISNVNYSHMASGGGN